MCSVAGKSEGDMTRGQDWRTYGTGEVLTARRPQQVRAEIIRCSLGWTVLTNRSRLSRIRATASSKSPVATPSGGNGICVDRVKPIRGRPPRSQWSRSLPSSPRSGRRVGEGPASAHGRTRRSNAATGSRAPCVRWCGRRTGQAAERLPPNRDRSGPRGRDTRGRYRGDAVPREGATFRPFGPFCRRACPPSAERIPQISVQDGRVTSRIGVHPPALCLRWRKCEGRLGRMNGAMSVTNTACHE